MQNNQSKDTVIIAIIFILSLFLSMTINPSVARAGVGDGIIDPGEDFVGEMARATQNPVASLISLPFQNNTNFNFGPRNKTQNVLNIQPVWPFELTDKWNLITRTIVPVISQPETAPGTDREFGYGDILFTAFLSPKTPFGKWIWGAGPAVLMPTANDDYLGQDRWAAGPSFVALTMRGPWVAGALFNNIWDFAGSGNADINFFTCQYFVNYNMAGGWYLISAPIITANWEGDSNDKWTIPFGGGLGRVFRIGKQPINFNTQAYYNVETPDNGPDWQLRIQLQFMFPK